MPETDASGLKVTLATEAELPLVFEIRREVFVREQGVSEAEEFDSWELTALHLLVRDADEQTIGTARLRLLTDGWAKLERIAVLKAGRGQGAGQALVRALLEQARAAGYTRFKLNAQCRVLDFYRAFGFVPVGPEFLEADIPHQEMRWVDGENFDETQTGF